MFVALLNKYRMLDPLETPICTMLENRDWVNFTRKDWRKVENLPLRAMDGNIVMKDYFEERVNFLKGSMTCQKATQRVVYIRYYSGIWALVNLYQDIILTRI